MRCQQERRMQISNVESEICINRMPSSGDLTEKWIRVDWSWRFFHWISTEFSGWNVWGGTISPFLPEQQPFTAGNQVRWLINRSPQWRLPNNNNKTQIQMEKSSIFFHCCVHSQKWTFSFFKTNFVKLTWQSETKLIDIESTNNRIQSHFIPFDSSLNALSKVYWVRVDRTKRSAANSR